MEIPAEASWDNYIISNYISVVMATSIGREIKIIAARIKDHHLSVEESSWLNSKVEEIDEQLLR